MRHTAINTPDQDSQDVCDSFNWLSRSNRGLEFISYSHYSHFPASSFDFGHRGYAARCSYGGQLLHLSAPSENHGLISVRGDFENSLYAALARAQRDDGGCSSFGLEFVDGLEPYHPRGTFLGSKKTGSTFIFGDSIDRGCLNYRWPYNERPLFLNEDSEISKAKNKWSVIEYKLGIWASRMRNKRSRKGVEEYKCNIEEAGTKEQKSHADATAGDMEVVYPYETREQFLNDVDRLFYEVTNRKLETDALWKMTTSDLRNLVGIDETEIENALDKDVSGIELLSLFGFRACGGEKHTGAIGSNDNDFNGSTKASGNSSSETLKAGEMIFSESAMSSTKASSGSEMSMKREREVGTCVTFSFIMHGTLYQILRVEQGAPSDHNTGTDQSDMFDNESQIVLRIGGLVRFSIPSSTMPSEIEEVTDNSLPSQHGHDNSGGDTINSLKFRARALGLTLEARIYQFEPTEPDGGKTSGNTCPHYRLLSLQKKPKEENYKRPIRNSSSAYRAFGRFSTQFGPQTKNNATFIAAIRLSDNPLDGQRPWRIPTPREIYNFVGLSKLRTYRSQATGALWETVFFQRCLVQNSLSRFEEVHLIGRSLERILQVDNVPFQFSPRQKASGCSVLINNTFMQPAIDYKSLFWKIRFLVKLHNFLQRLKRNSRREAQARSVNSKSSHVESISGNEKTLSVDFLDAHEEAPLKEMVAAQMTRIRKVLREIIQSLVQVLIHTVLDPSTMDRLFPTTDVSEESKRYYIIITLWYVVKNFGLAGSQWRQLGIIEGLLPLRKRSESLSDWFANTILPADDKIFRARDKGKISLLQWHHYGSILGLCQNGFLPGKWIRDNNLRSKVLQHQRAALVASAAKLSSTSPYSASDEIFDRLAFLGLELGLEKLTHDGSSVAALSMRRITNRDYTRSINQGKVEPNENGDFDGPWEVHALCHHSRLKVLQLESEDGGELSEQEENELREKLHVYKHKVSQFLNSEATIIPCWERSHIEARQGWIYSEASSVLASTLLDINTRYIQERFQDTQTRVQQTDQQLEALEDIWDTGYYQTQALEKLKEEMERQSRLLERLSPDAGYLPPVEWNNTWKLPRRYHPDNFIVSLEDTPWEYDPAKLEKTVTVPQPLRPFVNSPIGRDGGRFTIEDLKHLPDLSLIRIFDISDSTEERLKPNRVVDTRNDLVAKLYDSLVDQDVRHRLLVITEPRPSTELLTLLVYVFCRRSAICLSNHVLKLPRFSLEKGRNNWVARITITSWQKFDRSCSFCLRRPPCRCSFNPRKALLETDNELISLPQHLEENLANASRQSMELGMGRHQRPGIPCSGCMLCQQFCLQASSIILTTNLFGDFSKCCIISKHFYQSSASEPASLTLDSIGQDSRNIWLRFVHQPQTARCLAFYLILGQLCKEIAREYRHAMKAIDSVVKFDDIFNHKDGKRIDDEDVMPRFKIGLWALESLFRLQKSLRVTVASIRDARDELEAQINEGPGTRGEALEALCQHYVDTFESGFAALVWVDTKLDTDIALITRYKEGFNAVLTLNDSRESVKQNRTIQRLTYLTIGYLPMGLAAAIFAIPGEQHVVHEPMGRGWFIWCILILLVATSLAAFFIEGLLHSFRRVFLSIWRPLKTTINRLLRCLIAAWWLWTIYHKRRQYSKESLLSKKRHEVSQGV